MSPLTVTTTWNQLLDSKSMAHHLSKISSSPTPTPTPTTIIIRLQIRLNSNSNWYLVTHFKQTLMSTAAASHICVSGGIRDPQVWKETSQSLLNKAVLTNDQTPIFKNAPVCLWLEVIGRPHNNSRRIPTILLLEHNRRCAPQWWAIQALCQTWNYINIIATTLRDPRWSQAWIKLAAKSWTLQSKARNTWPG